MYVFLWRIVGVSDDVIDEVGLGNEVAASIKIRGQAAVVYVGVDVVFEQCNHLAALIGARMSGQSRSSLPTAMYLSSVVMSVTPFVFTNTISQKSEKSRENREDFEL